MTTFRNERLPSMYVIACPRLGRERIARELTVSREEHSLSDPSELA
jgi:hypothetical protein